ncbi:MAG: cytochrome C oxidase subunit IV family protein [Aeoliella sp.]
MSHEHTHHVTSLPMLFATFVALVLLTVLTVVLATVDGIDFGKFDVAVALVIATAKALLVALIFMQLAHDKPINGVILISALLFVGLFLSFTLMDTVEYRPEINEFILDNPKMADSP